MNDADVYVGFALIFCSALGLLLGLLVAAKREESEF